MRRISERLPNPFGPGGDVPAGSAVAAVPPAAAPARAAAEALPSLRPLSGYEEEYIERHLRAPNTAALCNEVLARCLAAPGEEPGPQRARVRDLLTAERDRALIELRRLSLGPEITAVVRCPSCGSTGEAAFSLDDLPVDFASPERVVQLDLEDGTPVVLRLPTAGDQADLLAAGLEGEAEKRSWLLGRVLISFGERRDGLDAGFARALPVGVRHRLEARIEADLPDLDLSMETACDVCGTRFSAPFDVAAFFFPR